MRSALGLLALTLALAACRTDTTTGSVVQASLQQADDAPRYSDWSAPVNIGEPVNSPAAELIPAESKDRLSLYFQCVNCPGNIGGPDIWVSHRASVEDPWGTPQNLGPTINTEFAEGNPALSRDGHTLYFNSTRPGGLGGNDLYAARRRDKRDDFDWRAPENLGSGVNSAANDVAPEYFVDDETGTVALYFTSDRTGGPGATDTYVSTRGPDGTFGTAALVPELSSAARDESPAIRRDGLEIFLASDRPGSIPPLPGMPAQVLDLWVSTRASTSEPWSTPVNLGPAVNSHFIDSGPMLSFDGTRLYFHSPFRPENVGGTMFDIWVTTRAKLTGQD
jgi:WD40-like Beta Propeller Repeat